MSGTSPNFDDWRKFSTIKIWEIAVLMRGFDPRALGNVMVSTGDPNDHIGEEPDFSFEERMLTSAVLAGKLTAGSGIPRLPNGQTEIIITELIPWLRNFDDYTDLIDGLVHTAQPALDAATGKPAGSIETATQRQDRRMKQCEDVGLTMDKTALSRLPYGVGVEAEKEGVSRQTFSADVRAAIKRKLENDRTGAKLHST
jgi:hypothetical protein